MQIAQAGARQLDLSARRTSTEVNDIAGGHEREVAAGEDLDGAIHPWGGTADSPAVVVEVDVCVPLKQEAVAWAINLRVQEEARGDGGAGEEGDKVVYGRLVGDAEGDDMCELKVDDDRHVVGDDLRRSVSVVMACEQAAVTVQRSFWERLRLVGDSWEALGVCPLFLTLRNISVAMERNRGRGVWGPTRQEKSNQNLL